MDNDFAQYVTQISGEIDDLQNQIDGNITTWFYDAVPTTTNAPAKDWMTDALKNQHLGDLYYDANGYCYRWQLGGSTYGWTRITDTDVTKALANAKTAQDTADGKRRVFVTTPTPPYDVGDMWAQGESGELLRCATAKKIGESYAASDWVKASKYTDDTLAKQAQEKIDGLQIGGRNLLLKSATKHISAYAGASLTFEDGVSVTEWGATDAIRCTGTAGTSAGFGVLGGVSVNNTSVSGQAYVHSIYVRNDGTKTIKITNNNLGGEEYVQSGESRRVVLKGKGDGEAALRFNFRTATAGDAINITYWHPKIELGNVATDWTPAPEDVDNDFAQYVTQIGGEIDDLQNQIDGNITTWFYDAAPTTSNDPAKNWTTDALKNQHLGDLYYDKNGYCYRWQLSGGTYGWTRITDTDVTTALADAKKAKDTADGKRRVFVDQPTPPYDVGDMWAQGESGDLMRCATAKAAGANYSESDWVKASKYTDDTTANQALTIAQKSEIYTGSNPPSTPITTGKLWIDTGVVPTVIRRWKGTGTSTDRDDGGWDTVSDLDEINEISNKLRAQQAEAQKAIDRLATAITIDTEGAHFYKPGYRDRSEVRIDQDSVDILVGGNVNSSFIAGGLILGNYMLWHPAAAGGLAFNLM